MQMPGLAFKAHRLLYHSTLGLKVIKKKKEGLGFPFRSGRVIEMKEEQQTKIDLLSSSSCLFLSSLELSDTKVYEP